jgi:serine/threonine-protein kinase
MKAGDRLFSYIVERELGEGGMGTVYLGRHTVLNQQVAIKALSPLLARDQALRERFIQEANIQAGLRHPGLVQVLTAEMEGEQPSLVMEYIEGKSLSEVLELRGALPIDDALKIMEQVLAAVGYAHRQGVVHRDLKPSNVMVMANGEAKVTDFGIAKVLGSTKLTRTGTAMGSAHYMSPEQIRRPETVDARSDIYSLGCVFYEVLTGRPPFGEKDASGTESDFEIKEGHVRGQIPTLHSLRPNIPEWLAHLVMQLLEKEPEQRPSSCEVVLESLMQSGSISAKHGLDKTVLVTGNDRPAASTVQSSNVPRFCTKCGAENTRLMKFCTSCGHRHLP